jgi:uncharacterized protein (TIGR02246 family)
MSTTAASTDVLRAMTAAFNDHDVDAIMEFFADDCVFVTPRGPEPDGRRLVGREAVRGGVEARFAGIPDVHYADDSHWICGDRGVSEWLLTGTTAEGTPVEVRGCDLWTFDDAGKVLQKDSYWKIVE